MTNKLLIILIASILIVFIPVAYYFIYYLPVRDEKIEQTKQQEQTIQLRKQAIKECEEVINSMGEIITNSDRTSQAKQVAMIKLADDWSKNSQERCIQNKIDAWKGL